MRIIFCLFLLAALLASHGAHATRKKKSSSGVACSEDFFQTYHSSKDLYQFTEACAAQHQAKITDIGKSAENVHLKVLSVGTGAKHIFIMAGMHGREWITPASTCWVMYHLLTSTADTNRNALLASHTIHFLPLLNPDGLDFSRTTNSDESSNQDRRQWRKNRRLLPCKGDRCAHGVDLNRNWGVAGVTFGFGATRPTSDVFQGKTPFSEPELKAVRSWLLEFGHKMSYVLDIHCCAQTILPPSYYHGESEELKAEHLLVAKHVAQAMSSAQITYKFREREKEFTATNSGISVDWLYGEAGAGLALIVETRGNDKSKKLENIFDVDSRSIVPIGRELLAAVYAVSKDKDFLPPPAVVTEPPPVVQYVAPVTLRPTAPETPAPTNEVTQEQQQVVVEEEENEDAPPPPPEEALEQHDHEPLQEEEENEETIPPPPPPSEDDEDSVGVMEKEENEEETQEERIQRIDQEIQDILSEPFEPISLVNEEDVVDIASSPLRDMHIVDQELVILDEGDHAEDEEEEDVQKRAQEQLRLRIQEIRQAHPYHPSDVDMTWGQEFAVRVERGKWKLPALAMLFLCAVWCIVNKSRVILWLRPMRAARYED